MTSSENDDEDLDAMMGSMRGMFRDMPDEEPPSRGLDALMAAARTQAAKMAPEPEKESWLRRALAMLTRPPVLAAATALVLVGSTVMLTRQSGMDTVATGERKTFETANKPSVDPQLRVREQTAEKKKAEVATAPPAANEGGAPPAAQQAVRPRPPQVARPAHDDKPPVAPQIAPPDEHDASEVKRPAGVQTGEDGNVGVKAVESPKPTPDAIAPETAADRPTATNRPTATARPPVSVDQLLQQAETAAGRKDCATVKVTAERIRKLDANAYKTRVVTKPALKNCL